MSKARATTFSQVPPGLTGLLLALPVLVFYAVSIGYTVNIPWFDDIENIPYFLLNWIDADTLTDKWSALLRPNNEHRVVSARLLVLMQYGLTGHINFRVLTFLGNLSVLGIAGLLTLNHRRSGGRYLWLAPAAFFVFNLQYYAMTTMTIMSMQYQLVIFLSFLSLYLLSKNTTPALVAALLVAVLDTFSMGNGMMVWPAGALLLLYQKQYYQLVIWVLAAALSIFGYFYGYDFVQGNEKGFEYILANPGQILLGSLAMIGGIFDFFPTLPFKWRMVLPVLAGLGMVLVLLVFLVLLAGHRWRPDHPAYRSLSRLGPQYVQSASHTREIAFWVGALSYLLISMLLVVFFRTRFNYELVLWSTYKIYPGTFTAIVYLLALRLAPARYLNLLFAGALALSLLACLSSYWYFVPEIETIRQNRQAAAFNHRLNGIGLSASKGTSFEIMSRETMRRVAELDLYHLPDPAIHPDEQRVIRTAVADTTDSLAAQLLVHPYVTEVIPTGLPAGTRPGKMFAVLRSDQNLYLFPVRGSSAGCPNSTLYAGTYAVQFWVLGPEGTRLLPTNQVLTVD
jgi:hypothetical protein